MATWLHFAAVYLTKYKGYVAHSQAEYNDVLSTFRIIIFW